MLEEALPETDHDFRLDLIVAGEEVIPAPTRRPRGILWEHLDAAKIAAIPALATRGTTSRTRITGTLVKVLRCSNCMPEDCAMS